jgi:NitT/TauT family transport system substrate-binding protein
MENQTRIDAPAQQQPGSDLTRRTFLRHARNGLMVPLAFGGVGLVLSACGGQQTADPVPAPSGDPTDTGPAARETLSARYMTALGLSLSFAEAMIAKEQGFFDEQGLFVEILGGSGTATALQSVLGGTSLLSRANAINGIISVANENAPIVSVATCRQGGQFELASLPDAPIASPSDLRAGMNIGIVSAAGATENLLDAMLLDQGIDPGSIGKPITGVGPAAFELARRGEIDGWVAVNTDRQAIQDDGEEVLAFNIYDYVDIPSDTFVTRADLMGTGDERVVRFLAGILQAIKWSSDPNNWEEAVANVRVYNPSINAEAAVKQMPLIVDDWLANGEDGVLAVDPDRWGRGQEILANLGLVNTPAPVDRLIDGSFLAEARTRV